VLSCDLLAPRAGAISSVVAQLATAPPDVIAAVPVVDGEHQWTHAAWRRTALAPLEQARRAGARSLRRACADLPLAIVTGLSSTDVADADDPEDLPAGR
jgi:hypothetical protein